MNTVNVLVLPHFILDRSFSVVDYSYRKEFEPFEAPYPKGRLGSIADLLHGGPLPAPFMILLVRFIACIRYLF